MLKVAVPTRGIAWADLYRLGVSMRGGVTTDKDSARRVAASRRGNRRGHRTLRAKALARRLGSGA